MENKQNFAGIIIPVIVAVILLTVLPIINSINEECPPCESCPSYNIGNMEVNPNFSSGDYIVDKNDYDYLDNVTIIQDENLIPENIKKGVNIFGVVGTYEVLLPTLYAPTVSISDDTLTITPNSNNGSFVIGYKIYVDGVLLDTTTSTTYDLSEELNDIGTYEIYVTAYATGFTDSDPSNVVEYVIEPVPTGPKLFEVGDVLPATTQLKISWTLPSYSFDGEITSNSGTFYIVEFDWPYGYVCGIEVYDDDDGIWIPPYTGYDGSHAYIVVDTSSWPLSKRTISNVDTVKFTWEDLNT